jgi:hypothetical protein
LLSNGGQVALIFGRGLNVFDLQNLFWKTVPGYRQHGAADLLGGYNLIRKCESD